jgi:hypothetical protein
VLREFVDKIIVADADMFSRTREIEIVYNFIGAFDFGTATEQTLNQAM